MAFAAQSSLRRLRKLICRSVLKTRVNALAAQPILPKDRNP
jgi:hypothetical protein